MSKTTEKLKSAANKTRQASALGALPLSLMAIALPTSRAEAAQAPSREQSSPVALAREIWQHDSRPNPHRHVNLIVTLPNGERAKMAMSSTTTNPEDTTSTSVWVSDPQKKGPNNLTPSAGYFFNEHDGSWTAVQRITNPEKDSTSVITVKNGTVVTDMRSFVGDKSLGAEKQTIVNNSRVANEVFNTFVADATAMAGRLAIGEPVPLSDLR